jgi:hypothetical protein
MDMARDMLRARLYRNYLSDLDVKIVCPEVGREYHIV